MNSPVCVQEALVIEATRCDLWDDELRNHVSDCRECAETAAAAFCLKQIEAVSPTQLVLPGAGQIWWKAKLRARREAVERATLPISFVQSITLILAAISFPAACFWQWDSLCSWGGSFTALWHLSPKPVQDFAAELWKSWNFILLAGTGAIAILVILATWLAHSEE